MIKTRAIADAMIEAHVIKAPAIKAQVAGAPVVQVAVIKEQGTKVGEGEVPVTKVVLIKERVIKDGPIGAGATRSRAAIAPRIVIANRGTRRA